MEMSVTGDGWHWLVMIADDDDDDDRWLFGSARVAPLELFRVASSLTTFRRKLKTHLFRQSYAEIVL